MRKFLLVLIGCALIGAFGCKKGEPVATPDQLSKLDTQFEAATSAEKKYNDLKAERDKLAGEKENLEKEISELEKEIESLKK
mgnify:CR=1 FL=1